MIITRYLRSTRRKLRRSPIAPTALSSGASFIVPCSTVFDESTVVRSAITSSPSGPRRPQPCRRLQRQRFVLGRQRQARGTHRQLGIGVQLERLQEFLGGQFRLAGMQPRRGQIQDLLGWYERQFDKLGVKLVLKAA